FSSFLFSAVALRPLRKSEAVADAQVETGRRVVDAVGGRATDLGGRAAVGLGASNRRVHGGTLGQVVHVAQGDLAGARVASQVDFVLRVGNADFASADRHQGADQE